MAQIKSLPAAHRLAEILIAGLMLALAAAPGAVGEAAFRLAAAALLIALALGIAVLAVRRAKPDGGETGSRRRIDQALAGLALTAAYFGVMQAALVSFQWATVVYIFLLTAQLLEWHYRHLPGAMLMAILIGLGLQFAFTNLIFLGLP